MHSFQVVLEVSCGSQAELAEFLEGLRQLARAPMVDAYYCRPMEDVEATALDTPRPGRTELSPTR